MGYLLQTRNARLSGSKQIQLKLLGCNAKIIKALYLGATQFLLSYVASLYIRLCTFPRLGDRPPRIPPSPFAEKSIPFESADDRGSLMFCNKGICSGNWKPPRSHHCSTCGVCKENWDHHVCILVWAYAQIFKYFLL